MARDIEFYFETRASAEDRLAEMATHPGVKETHRRFAAAFRQELFAATAPSLR